MKTVNWSNWSGSVQCSPIEVLFPENEDEIISIVHMANEQGKKIRVVGSGHSFSHLIETNDYILSLDKFRGLIEVDKVNMRVRVKAGTKIKEFGALLFEQGLAQEI